MRRQPSPLLSRTILRMDSAPAEPEESARLLLRIAAGDESAVHSLYDLHGGAILTYLLGLGAEPGEAEEILQDTFSAVWTGASKFEGRSRARTWLLSIARRRARDRARRHEPPVSDHFDQVAASGGESEPERLAIARIELAQVTTAIRALSPLHREALNLTFFHQLSYEEVAEVVGVPVGTVKSRISNARLALKTALQAGNGPRE